MKKTKKKQNRGTLKESITHGVFNFSSFGSDNIYCRNTKKYLPLPVKFRELLEKKYLIWWYIKRTIYRFGKPIKIKCLADYPVEFVINHIPEIHLMVISICHPLDQFKRKSGVKIVKQRMKWALEHPKKEKNWKHQLK